MSRHIFVEIVLLLSSSFLIGTTIGTNPVPKSGYPVISGSSATKSIIPFPPPPDPPTTEDVRLYSHVVGTNPANSKSISPSEFLARTPPTNPTPFSYTEVVRVMRTEFDNIGVDSTNSRVTSQPDTFLDKHVLAVQSVDKFDLKGVKDGGESVKLAVEGIYHKADRTLNDRRLNTFIVTDPPGQTDIQNKLVGDLQAELTKPNPTVFYREARTAIVKETTTTYSYIPGTPTPQLERTVTRDVDFAYQNDGGRKETRIQETTRYTQPNNGDNIIFKEVTAELLPGGQRQVTTTTTTRNPGQGDVTTVQTLTTIDQYKFRVSDGVNPAVDLTKSQAFKNQKDAMFLGERLRGTVPLKSISPASRPTYQTSVRTVNPNGGSTSVPFKMETGPGNTLLQASSMDGVTYKASNLGDTQLEVSAYKKGRLTDNLSFQFHSESKLGIDAGDQVKYNGLDNFPDLSILSPTDFVNGVLKDPKPPTWITPSCSLPGGKRRKRNVRNCGGINFADDDGNRAKDPATRKNVQSVNAPEILAELRRGDLSPRDRRKLIQLVESNRHKIFGGPGDVETLNRILDQEGSVKLGDVGDGNKKITPGGEPSHRGGGTEPRMGDPLSQLTNRLPGGSPDVQSLPNRNRPSYSNWSPDSTRLGSVDNRPILSDPGNSPEGPRIGVPDPIKIPFVSIDVPKFKRPSVKVPKFILPG